MGLVSRGRRGLADRVDEADSLKPLLVGELDLADEVVQVADQLAHDEARPLVRLGAHGIDDGIGEVGVEAVLGAVLLRLGCRLLGAGGHCGCVGVCEGVCDVRGVVDVYKRENR